MTGGDLFQAIVRHDVLDKRTAALAVREILLGLRYIHDNFICHRDMKPENVLLDSRGHCKIADFGVACYYNDENLAMNEWAGTVADSSSIRPYASGTMLYMAPEMLNGKGYTSMVDLWATGVIAYNALSGTNPFDSVFLLTVISTCIHIP